MSISIYQYLIVLISTNFLPEISEQFGLYLTVSMSVYLYDTVSYSVPHPTLCFEHPSVSGIISNSFHRSKVEC